MPINARDIVQFGDDAMSLDADIPESVRRKATDKPVQIPPHGLPGILTVPDDADTVIVFAHGSGSNRLSPRNTYVARGLQRAGMATLLLDLLSVSETEIRANLSDIPLLAQRLLSASNWAAEYQRTSGLRLGYFGAGTGAAAALTAATLGKHDIRAVVSRSGRPAMAIDALSDVTAPTLLIVGEWDEAVLDRNRDAFARLNCEKELRIVPGATHLFEEPGALDTVIHLTCRWFHNHFRQ